MTVPPAAGVPLHHHAVQEAFTLLEGSAEFGRLGDDGQEWLPLRFGDVVNVPNWAYHGCRHSGPVPARIQPTCAAGLEPFFRESGLPVEAGRTLNTEPPSESAIERVATIAAKHGSYFYEGVRK
jgi:hypothetical protein